MTDLSQAIMATQESKKKTPIKRVGKKGGKKGVARKAPVPSRSLVDPKQGLYIDPNVVRYWLDDGGINAAIATADNELRAGEPHKLKDESTSALIPLAQMSVPTQRLVAESLRERAENKRARAETEAKADIKHAAERKRGGAEYLREQKEKVEREVKRTDDLNRIKAEKKVKFDAENARRVAAGLPAKVARVITGDRKHKGPYAEELAAIASRRIKFDKKSANLLAAGIDAALHQVLESATQTLVATKKRTLQIAQIVDLSTHNQPLAKPLTFRRLWGQHREEVLKRDAEDAKKKAEKKAEAKRLRVAAKALKEGKAVEPEVKDDVKRESKEEAKETKDVKTAEPEEEENPRSFRTQIRRVFYNVCNKHADATYAKLYISSDAISFLDDIIRDYIKNGFVEIIRCHLDTTSVKKVSVKIIEMMLKQQLTHSDVRPESIICVVPGDLVIAVEPENAGYITLLRVKLTQYAQHLKAKKEQRFEREKISAEKKRAEADEMAKRAAEAARIASEAKA